MQESHKIARERLINKKIKSKKQYDKKEFSEDLDVKDLILLKDKTQKNKLSPLWKGPFEILEVLDTENVVIQRGRRKVTVHKNDVKRYYEKDKLDKDDQKSDTKVQVEIKYN